MTLENAAFGATLVGGVVAVILSARGRGKIAFVALSALFAFSSWIILGSHDAIPGTDGQAMMWGVMIVLYAFSLVLVFVLRKRTDAIF